MCILGKWSIKVMRNQEDDIYETINKLEFKLATIRYNLSDSKYTKKYLEIPLFLKQRKNTFTRMLHH